MVKRGSSTFSAASVAKGSVVLSCMVEKNFALEAEISRLRHQVSVLSRRLHLVTLERDGLVDMVAPTVFVEEEWGEMPQTDEEVAGEDEENEATPSVAESVCPSVAMVEVAGEVDMARVAEEVAVGVAGEGVEEVTAPGVANAEVVDSHCVAGEETEMDAWVVGTVMSEGERDRRVKLWLKKWAEGEEDRRRAREREENTAVEMVESAPEMAENCNRFELDLVEEVDSVPDPLIPSCVDDLVRMRGAELEAEGGWPVLSGRGVDKFGEGMVRELGSSGDEDAIVGGVIVAGGASQKARNAARKKKRKIRPGEASGRGGGG